MSSVIKYKGYNINIKDDSEPMNPLTEFDSLGKITYWNSRYTLGHENGDKKYGTIPQFLADIAGIDLDDVKKQGQALHEYLITEASKANIILPVYAYIHGGVTLKTTRFSDIFDSGLAGFIWVTKEAVLKEYGTVDVPVIEEYLRGQIATLDEYFTGEVYGYVIEDQQGEDIGSCWGFFGSNNRNSGLLESAESEIDHHIETTLKKHIAQRKAQMKAHTPLDKRQPLNV